MPHIKTGELLHVGDVVLVEFKVKEVWTGEDYCNTQLEYIEPFYPDTRHDCVTVNTRMISSIVSHALVTEDGELSGKL